MVKTNYIYPILMIMLLFINSGASVREVQEGETLLVRKLTIHYKPIEDQLKLLVDSLRCCSKEKPKIVLGWASQAKDSLAKHSLYVTGLIDGLYWDLRFYRNGINKEGYNYFLYEGCEPNIVFVIQKDDTPYFKSIFTYGDSLQKMEDITDYCEPQNSISIIYHKIDSVVTLRAPFNCD